MMTAIATIDTNQRDFEFIVKASLDVSEIFFRFGFRGPYGRMSNGFYKIIPYPMATRAQPEASPRVV